MAVFLFVLFLVVFVREFDCFVVIFCCCYILFVCFVCLFLLLLRVFCCCCFVCECMCMFCTREGGECCFGKFGGLLVSVEKQVYFLLLHFCSSYTICLTSYNRK